MGPVPLRLLLMAGIAFAWRCPQLNDPPASCACDLPQTLRCVADGPSLSTIARRLRNLPPSSAVSLLDITAHNVSTLPAGVLSGVSLHGLVISSGQLTDVAPGAFSGLETPMQALGLPNNLLVEVPSAALQELRGLDRLDLSHNKLVSLNNHSFAGCDNLTFLDLSENLIERIDFGSFSGIQDLGVLRLRGNRLAARTLVNMSSLHSLSELDLSCNELAGPLSATFLPSLPALETLILSENNLSSARHGMLRGTPGLLTLSLSRNQIDVVEDHAFLELVHLRTLDLAGNRIVAVSGSSLSHLAHLTELNLAHNFLRALTADLVAPLANLRELRLDDNDISMVMKDALPAKVQLQRLTLADNPLNCDCSLVGFAGWLGNSTVPAADRRTAVCATPPALENALLAEVPSSDLRCGEDSDTPTGTVPLSTAQATLRAFHFDGNIVTLLWSTDSTTAPFSCDALFVYEETQDQEALLSSTPLRCNSSMLADPTALTVRLPAEDLLIDHKYRYCIVLQEPDRKTGDIQFILGCSEVIRLAVTSQSVAQPPRLAPPTRISAVSANITNDALTVGVTLWDFRRDPQCRITITVLASSALAAQHHVNCSAPRLVVSGLPPGPYHVCATLGAHPPAEPRVTCIPVPVDGKSTTNIAFFAVFACVVTAILLLLYIVARRLRRPRIVTTHQCFMATSEPEEGQHARYVKLHATTKL